MYYVILIDLFLQGLQILKSFSQVLNMDSNKKKINDSEKNQLSRRAKFAIKKWNINFYAYSEIFPDALETSFRRIECSDSLKKDWKQWSKLNITIIYYLKNTLLPFFRYDWL